MVAIIRRNAKTLRHILDDVRPDVVVTDSDYNFLPVRSRKIPLVALNNADVMRHSYFGFKDRPASIRAQFFCVEMLDYWFHRVVPDLVLSPTLQANIPQSGKNIFRTGPIVRQGYEPSQVHRPPKRAAVMLSGSVFGTPVNFNRSDYPVSIDVIGREEPRNWLPRADISFHGKLKDTYPLLKAADIVVINGGFSAVSEMFWMRKPMVVIPVARHAEQWINARTIVELGLGMIATESNYEEILIEAIERVEQFDAGYRRIKKNDAGAAQAATTIMNIAKADRH